MCSKGKEVHMGFTGETFPPGVHMCYIYNDEAQRKKVISQFLESGLLSGEKASYFMDVITIDEMNEYFSSLGLDKLLKEYEGHFSVVMAKSPILCIRENEITFGPSQRLSSIISATIDFDKGSIIKFLTMPTSSPSAMLTIGRFVRSLLSFILFLPNFVTLLISINRN
ncbi:MAG: hypothetical protein NTX36_14055 [Proteobacteria bacterium]|nr:hypothetical protein [Pseudomonadota bacterium]